MSQSLYNGQITDRDDSVFAEGNVHLYDPLCEGGETGLELILKALLKGKRSKMSNGVFFLCDDYWLHIRENGDIELGEGAA